MIDESDHWLFVSSEQSSVTAATTANAFHTLKVRADGMLTEPFPPTVLPIGGSVPVRAQGITVVGAGVSEAIEQKTGLSGGVDGASEGP